MPATAGVERLPLARRDHHRVARRRIAVPLSLMRQRRRNGHNQHIIAEMPLRQSASYGATDEY